MCVPPQDDYLDDTGIFVRETKYGGAAVKNILKNQKGILLCVGSSTLANT